ncbi:hypothetical protein SAY87_022391 [Trapa incisa]|uniref:Histone deacetylase n=1 Tax=Trapa incisa TaxID=236973 RepID=A0AAN7Q943_9MYRT|nr:hypothetical protein SAY87_022391 [Trapa incisa]
MALLVDRDDIMNNGEGNSLPSSGADGVKKKVSYFYASEVGNCYYGQGNPMKPHRIRMTHTLLAHYGLLQHTQVVDRDLAKFHVDTYISFLRNMTHETHHYHMK